MKKVIGGLVVVASLMGAAAGVHEYRIGEMRGPVAKMLKDPGSAQFQSEAHEGGWIWPRGPLCGEVNAKNNFGAYTGFKRFISASDGAAYVEGLGYVDADKDGSSRNLLADMNIENDVLRNVLQIGKDSGGKITYTQDQIEKMVESAIFDRRWSEICQ